MEETHPHNWLKGSGKIALIVGIRSSGKSTLISSIQPKHIVSYFPRFSCDRKKLIVDLGQFSAHSIVGIETGLPALIENADALLRELALLAKIRKHFYLVEWTAKTEDQIEFLLSTTYCKYPQNIIATYGISKDTRQSESAGRFSSIGSMIEEQIEWTLEYAVFKHEGSTALSPERIKYDISQYIPNKFKEKNNA